MINHKHENLFNNVLWQIMTATYCERCQQRKIFYRSTDSDVIVLSWLNNGALADRFVRLA